MPPSPCLQSLNPLPIHCSTNTSSISCSNPIVLLRLPSDNMQYELPRLIAHDIPEKRKASETSRKTYAQSLNPFYPTTSRSSFIYSSTVVVVLAPSISIRPPYRVETLSWHRALYPTFKPLGGSFVIFTPFWRIDTGKSLQGIDVSHSRKSLCTASGLRSSQSRSSSASQDM